MLRTAWLVAQLHIDLYRTSAPPIADRARRTGASDLWCIWWAVVPNCPLSPKEIADDRYGEYLNNGKAYAAGRRPGLRVVRVTREAAMPLPTVDVITSAHRRVQRIPACNPGYSTMVAPSGRGGRRDRGAPTQDER